MRTWLVLLLVATTPIAASAGDRLSATKLELVILEAPGPVGCYTDMRQIRLIDCEEREAAVAAFKKLAKLDKKRAYAVVEKRFEEIPSPRGGYLPILLAVVADDPAFIPHLKTIAAEQPKSQLAVMAKVAAYPIKNGTCSDKTPAHYRELCMASL